MLMVFFIYLLQKNYKSTVKNLVYANLRHCVIPIARSIKLVSKLAFPYKDTLNMFRSKRSRGKPTV